MNLTLVWARVNACLTVSPASNALRVCVCMNYVCVYVYVYVYVYLCVRGCVVPSQVIH